MSPVPGAWPDTSWSTRSSGCARSSIFSILSLGCCCCDFAGLGIWPAPPHFTWRLFGLQPESFTQIITTSSIPPQGWKLVGFWHCNRCSSLPVVVALSISVVSFPLLLTAMEGVPMAFRLPVRAVLAPFHMGCGD